MALACVGVALGVSLALERVADAATMFLAAVMAATWFCGTGPGLTAAVVATVVFEYFYIPPFHTLDVGLENLPRVAVFALTALLMGTVSGVRRRAERVLRQARDELDEKVRERTVSLRRSESLLAESQRQSHIGSWALNPVTLDYYRSDEAARIFGYDPGAPKQPFDEVFARIHPADRPSIEQEFATSIAARRDMEYEYRYVRPDGSLRHLQTLGHPVRDERGELVEYVGTILDITERRQAEEALQKTQAELANVTRVMTMGEIAASIAHEVNQPLAAVVMSGNACRRWLLADPPNIAEAREAVQRIISDGNRASQVIGRIRALLQKTAPQQASLNVNELIQETLMLTRAELARHEVTVQTALGADLPRAVGDRIQLQQVLVNLILNGADAMSAIADRPRVLTVRSQPCDGGVLVDVQDTGVGLSAAEPDRIFQAFFSTKPHGLGMGLSISRSIVEAHGGRMWATPNDDGRPGATLHFTLSPRGDP